MTAGGAKRIAKEWVCTIASGLSGYCGAWLSGSVARLPDDAPLPVSSDVDVMVALKGEQTPPKPGKFLYEGVLLEVTYVAFTDIATSEKVLASYHMAGGFVADTRLDDPTGHLERLVHEVSREFAQPEWEQLRRLEARTRAENGLRNTLSMPALPLPDTVLGWLFPTGVMAHVLLVAALRNPTIRLRYLAVRDVLHAMGRHEAYEALLSPTGYADWTPERTARHLPGLSRVFDAACSVGGTPFPFRSDISASSRPIAIDGCEALIRAGSHREAVFWITATYARCHAILLADGTHEMQAAHLPAFHALLDDLGARTSEQRAEKAAQALAWFPELDRLADFVAAHRLKV